MQKCYEEQCKNVRMLVQASTAIQKELRKQISLDDEHRIIIFTRLFSLIADSWAEASLVKLVYEDNAFTQDEKKILLNHKTSIENRWILALQYSFCKRFRISDSSLISAHNEGEKHEKLVNVIKNDLAGSRTIRNKVAHGQWRVAFNSKQTKVNKSITKSLDEDNILRIRFRLELFEALSGMIHDLAISKTAFVEQFDEKYKIIENQKLNLKYVSYQKYREKLIAKRELQKKALTSLRESNALSEDKSDF